MKTERIYLGCVNASPTMPKSGITGIYSREYTVEEVVDKLKRQQEAGVPIENFVSEEEICQTLKTMGLELPERDEEKIIFGIPAWCAYYKLCIDRNDKLIIHRWNYYPIEEIVINNKIED